MKYIRFHGDNGPCWGAVDGGRVRVLEAPPYEAIRYTGQVKDLSDCPLLAPVEPSKIVCVGKNYYDHAVEMGEGIPEVPILFLKGPNVLNSPGGAITAPDFVTRVDYEGELGVVIRKRAKAVKAENALDYVLGYTCFNDVTARVIQKSDGQWTRGKSMDGFGPCGPWITDEVDPADLAVTTRLNGQIVQQSRTGLLMRDVARLIEFITASMTLEPGDLIATGTPAGIGPMYDGDWVEVEIEGVGTLGNPVVLPNIPRT